MGKYVFLCWVHGQDQVVSYPIHRLLVPIFTTILLGVAGKSTLLQVLVSIQSMILCDEPYLNEPGWANSGGTPQSKAYSANVRRMVVNTAVRGQIDSACRLLTSLSEDVGEPQEPSRAFRRCYTNSLPTQGQIRHCSVG